MNRVALVTISRDDSRHVERLLSGMRSFVDDMVVLDLGSHDDTVAKAERLGARAVEAAWTDDPSSLWNRALSTANAAWHIVIEPHEWIDAGMDELRRLGESVPDSVGLVEVVPGAAARGADVPSLQPRILPGSVRYGGRYRPEPLYPGMRTWRTEVRMASDDAQVFGWSHDRELVGAAVKQALSLRPQDPRLWAELGRWQRAEGKPSDAAGAFARAADTIGIDILERHAYVVEALDALRAARRFEDAVALVDAEAGRWDQSPDFAYVLGDVFFEMILADREKAATLAPMAEACWRRALALNDRPDLPGSLTGRGSFLAAQSLSVLHTTLGHPDEAEHWWGKASELRLASSFASQPRLL